MNRNIFTKSALALTAAAALAGCVKDPKCGNPVDYSNLKFVLNIDGPSDVTRALKPGWASGDKVVAFFGAVDKYATFKFDGTNWKIDDTSAQSVVGITDGVAQAIHVGNTGFSFDGTTLSGLHGDMLYDIDGGSYDLDAASSVVYVNLQMDRGFTTAIKMQGQTGSQSDEDYRLAGENIWVMADDTKTITAAEAFTPEAGLQSLFIQSKPEDFFVAKPDGIYNGQDMPVFHVWDKDPADSSTTFIVYNHNDMNIVERTYAHDMTAGSSILIQGPDSATESGSWTTYTARTVAIDGATPADKSVTVGAISGSLDVTATPTPAATTVTYQWYSNTTAANAGGSVIDGATSASFDIPTDLAVGSYYYYVVVTPAGGTAATSRAATVTVGSAVTLVTAAAPTGVVSPAAGATPATTITPGNAQYTAALAWDASPALTGDGKFANGTAYSATVTLTAASGNTFTGGFANGDDLSGFAVNGVTPTWVSNSGTDLVLSYAFPATAAAVTAGAVGGVTAPVVGATPATAVTPTSEYTGTIAWNPADAAFAQGTTYTATVTMTAANGFTFANMDAAALAAAYPVAGANAPAYSVSADGKTLTITAPFTATPANGVTYGPNGADEDWN